MKVLHLISGRGPTGAAAAAIQDVLSLRAAGHWACVGCRRDAPAIPEALKRAGVPSTDIFAEFRFGRGALGMLTALRDAALLARLARSESIEIVHVHRAAENWLALLSPGRAQRPPLIRTWHRDPRGEHRPLLSTLAGNAAGCVCVSREHETTLLGAGVARARFIHGATDTQFFRPRLPNRSDSRFVIGQAARWKREHGRDRGQRFTLDIFSRLASGLNWRGELVGRGELADELERRAFDELELARARVAVVSTQQKSAEEFATILSGFDLGLVFSTGSDGTSRPALEQLACGVPLLVADTPGLRELAEDSACARVIPSGAAEEWARAIEALLRDPEQLRAMQAAGRARAEAVHSLKARGEALAEFYRECAKK